MTTPHQARRRPTLILAVFLAVLGLSAARPVAAQAPATKGDPTPTTTLPPGTVVHSWALVPGEAKGQGERTSFSYELAPGGEAHDVATLINYSNVPLTFFVYATDAFNNSDGAFDLLPFDKKPSDVGTWFDLPDGAAVTIPPRQQSTFPFTIRVPADARPGDHAGAVLASSAALGTNPEGGTVTVDRRTGGRVYVRVAGDLEPGLTVEKLDTTFDPSVNPFGGTATVTYDIVNRGNVRLGVKHRASVAGPFGVLKTSSEERTLGELLPGERASFTATLHGVTATGLAFTKIDMRPVPVGDDDDLEPVDASAFLFALPITVLAAIAVTGLLVFARRRYQRRRTMVTRRVTPVAHR